MKPTSNGRVRNIQLGKEIEIACLANRIAEPGVVAASRKSYLRTISYRHLDAPTFRVADESNLLHKSEALQLQQSSSRMSWNAAGKSGKITRLPDSVNPKEKIEKAREAMSGLFVEPADK